MPRQISIVTPENVKIDYELAGIASRAGAAFFDTLLQLVLMGLLGWGLVSLGSMRWMPKGGWYTALIIVCEFLLFWGFFIFFETTSNGQTPGKRWLRLRTVRVGGLPVDFPCAAVRNLIRLVDYFTFGWIAITLTSNNQRLGDLAAGTLVVKEHAAWAPDLQQINSTEPTITATTELVQNVQLVTPEEFEAVKRFLDRRAELLPDAREQIAAKIAKPLMTRLGMDENAQVVYSDLLAEIHKACVEERGFR